MKLVVLNAAQTELEDAQAYYLQRTTPGITAAFVADYEHSARRIPQFPQPAPMVSPRLRTLPMRHFPYSIIYYVTAEAISILAIAHQGRRPEYWGGRR